MWATERGLGWNEDPTPPPRKDRFNSTMRRVVCEGLGLKGSEKKKVSGPISRRVAGLFLGGAKIINMDCAQRSCACVARARYTDRVPSPSRNTCQSSSPYEIRGPEPDQPLKPMVGILSTNGVGFSCAKWASDQEATEGADMVINQRLFEHCAPND